MSDAWAVVVAAALAAATSLVGTWRQHARTRRDNSTEHAAVLGALLDLQSDVGELSGQFSAHLREHERNDR